MDFVFGRLLIRALGDPIVLIVFMAFPIHCGIYHDPTWATQPPLPPLSEDCLCQIDNVNHSCTNPRHRVTQANKFCTLAPNVCGSSVWNCLYVSLLAPGILRWLLDFWQICGHLTYILHIIEQKFKACSIVEWNSVVSPSRFPYLSVYFVHQFWCRFYLCFVEQWVSEQRIRSPVLVLHKSLLLSL